MDKPMDAFLRMGLVHFMAFPALGGGQGPWEETVRTIALDPFFTALEITHIVDDGERARVRDLLRLANLAVGFGAHPTILGGKLDINSLDDAVRASALAKLKELLDEAIFMGAESFVVLSGKDPGDQARPAALDALVRSLSELCVYSAERGGPKVVAEVFDRAVDKCCLLGPADLAAEVARRVSESQANFGLLVDLSHIPLLGESPEQALIPVESWLTGAHLGNAVLDKTCAGHGDNHPIFGSPGSVNGLEEMVAFLRTLMQIGFLGPERRPMVSFEVKPLPGQDSLVVIANAKRMMNAAWALV